MHKTSKLILASSSPWRRELLARLNLDFESISPDIDETPRPNEPPADLVRRLSHGKADKIARDYPRAIVIGSDQVAVLDNVVIGKPGTRANAVAQLRRQSGRRVLFHTGLCVMAPVLEQPLTDIITVETRFRRLTDEQIQRYVDAEDVTATAGSIKSEGLGISLVESISSDDPTALIGLPLIALRGMLESAGFSLP